MQINTLFNVGDTVTDGIVTGRITDISIWTTDSGVGIEYRVTPPGGNWVEEGHWATESMWKAVSE